MLRLRKAICVQQATLRALSGTEQGHGSIYYDKDGRQEVPCLFYDKQQVLVGMRRKLREEQVGCEEASLPRAPDSSLRQCPERLPIPIPAASTWVTWVEEPAALAVLQLNLKTCSELFWVICLQICYISSLSLIKL